MSYSSDQLSDVPLPTGSVQLSTSLEELQSDEQRRVLDIVAQIRKYGLQGDLSLPQIIVCGDQSAGKSSVLEALTEIPFPRSDSLCTRFATEITLSFNYYYQSERSLVTKVTDPFLFGYDVSPKWT